MKLTISQAEVTAIRKAQAEQANRTKAKREKAELDAWLNAQELRAGTQ